MTEPTLLRLADYRRPAFVTDLVALNFDIHDDHTIVTSDVTYLRTDEGRDTDELVLNAENPNPEGSPDYVRSLKVDGQVLAAGNDYTYDKEKNEIRLPVARAQASLRVEIETFLEPKKNAALTGLYESDGLVITQCESEGFRRITPFTDRPDVMALYKVRIEAPEDSFPVLLANGNQTGGGKAEGGRHWASFEDPFRKPSYLFCTANGPFVPLQDTYTTTSGQIVDLRTYVQRGEDPELVRHALNALKISMEFDEAVFGCEYDLDNFKTVAVRKFNFGAMENKGLNVFLANLLKASPATATDANYQYISEVVAHEYFHNWSGNRVTLANWFNISLKEGLTVRRDNMFAAHVTSTGAQRIDFVQGLRQNQFAEDDGPLSHPVLPKEVMSVENCYSMTIYEKGSEVIRMMGELMGQDKLIDGIKAYFRTYDGQAVTIDEFIACMEKISGLDFSGQFRLWYDQSGRPRVKAQGAYDATEKTYTLTLEQSIAPSKDQPVKQPMLIPVRLGLVDADGTDMPLILASDSTETPERGARERVVRFCDAKQTFVFTQVEREPAFHSLLRGFSAIVDLDPGLSQDQLYKQMLLDSDGFNRWEAGQKIAMAEFSRLYHAYETTGKMPAVDERYLESLRLMTRDAEADPVVLAKTMSQPSIDAQEISLGTVNPASLIAVRKHLRKTFGEALREDWLALFERVQDDAPYRFDYASVGQRNLKRFATTYLTASKSEEDRRRAKDLYLNADNMTDKIIAMAALCDQMSPEREAVFDDFYRAFRNDAVVIQKWFAWQALSNNDDIIGHLTKIAASDVFDWQTPGHVRGIFGNFAQNYEQFHRQDGAGYAFVADAIVKENDINPTVAAGLVEYLCAWHNYVGPHAKMMIEQLDRIRALPSLHKQVMDKILRSLPDEGKRAALGLPPLAERADKEPSSKQTPTALKLG